MQEFQYLTPNNTVYKLIGPVLVQQDQAEAKSNVDKRLEFIQGEMYVSLCLRSIILCRLMCLKQTRGRPDRGDWRKVGEEETRGTSILFLAVYAILNAYCRLSKYRLHCNKCVKLIQLHHHQQPFLHEEMSICTILTGRMYP